MVGTRVYVGGLPYGTSERDLERFFRGYGRMRDVLIKNGYGFVEFDDYRDADDAVYELNGKKLLGERVTVEKARGTPRGRDQWSSSGGSSGRGGGSDYRSHERYGPPTRTNYRLIVENLSSRVSWQDLKDYMRQAGEVTYADAHKQHRNEGVVEFASHSDMKNALDKLDDTEINGRRIRLIEDRSGRKSRSASYSSRSRSRSRSVRKSRSRSRSRSKSRSKSRSANGKDHSKSRSRSNSRKKSPDDRSRSVSRKKSVERSKSRSRSRSHSDHIRSKSRDGSKDRSKSRSRSVSKDRSKSRSNSPSDK